MSFAEFTVGLLQLALVAGLVGFTAYRVRARLLPGYTGSPGRLVEIVVAVGLLVVGAELLGLFGLLQTWPLTVLLGLAALASWLWLMPRPAGPDDPAPPGPPISTSGQFVAFFVAFAVCAQWGAFTSYNLDQGMVNFDSVWYHMPFAAEIARSGSVTGFFQPETVFVNWFYPQNSELLHGIGMILTGRDFVSIFVNLGWLAVALLAAWCVGRPYGRPQLTMLAVAILLGTHTLVVREPGTGKNDIMAAALILAAVAIMLNRSAARPTPPGWVRPDWAMAAGGLAIGLAAGTKVTALAPAVFVTCAVIYATMPGTRLRAMAVWFGAAFIGGGWWYLRNLLAAGNPLPQIRSIGPIDLPGPDRLQVGRPDFSVAHYLTDKIIWEKYFVPGLDLGFGAIWPLLFAVSIGGLVLVMFTAHGRLTRTHGAVALLAILAYLITPLSASGPEGDPSGFKFNLRFLIPALGMGVVLIPLSTWFDRGWRRYGLGLLLVVLFIGTSATELVLSAPGRNFGVLLALVFVAVPFLAWLARDWFSRYSRLPSLAVAIAFSLVFFSLLAWPIQRIYFDNRYQAYESGNGSGMTQPYRWANGVSDSTIALGGTTAGFRQYGFLGPDLSNRVIYIGQDAPHRGFDAIGTCEEFAQAVNGIDPDYLVTSPYLNFMDYEEPLPSPETYWAANDGALDVKVPPVMDSDRPVVVWQVNGPMDPERCETLRPKDDYIPGLRED